MQALIVEPLKAPYVKEIGEELEDLQHEVGGYIETVHLPDGAVIICDEESKLKGNAKLNRAMVWVRPDRTPTAWDTLFGTILIAGTDGEEFCDLDAQQVKKWTLKAAQKNIYIME